MEVGVVAMDSGTRGAADTPGADAGRALPDAQGQHGQGPHGPGRRDAAHPAVPADQACALDAMDVDTSGIDAQLAVVLSYNGAPFAGFARQPGAHTVQGTLEEALGMALHRPVQVVCAGRTDAGVHARGQVVSFPMHRNELEQRNLGKLKRSMQALCGQDIAVHSLSVMPPQFSARFSAVSREYRYLVMPGQAKPLFLRDWCWDVRRDLDVDAMNRAAALLEGEHDFKSFCLAASAQGRNTVRRLDSVRVVPVNVLGEDALSIRVVGTAFLHSMVRCMVGTLVAVGAGRRDPAWVLQVLDARDRAAAGENAPARGLVFWNVEYRGGIPCRDRDVLTAQQGAYCGYLEQDAGMGCASDTARRGAATSAFAASGVTDQDVAIAQAMMDAMERDEPDDAGRDVPTAPQHASPAFADAALDAVLPDAVERAARAKGPEGSVKRNPDAGPAVAAAPRTRRIAPADPQPAEGEVSFQFEVPRESAAARAARRQNARRRGLFDRLFGGDADGGGHGG